MLWVTILAALIIAALVVALLLSIKELEFDLHMGKLSPEDHQRLDQRLRQQTITLLRQIAQTAPQVSGLEAELEAAIQQQRRVIARAVGTGQSTLHCPHCQTAVGRADKFCPQCGQKLTPVEGSPVLSLP
jgi:NADH pyrophosphatase NudC (nudix superfamily)